ncbi:pentatricopeptide repeat-containing protein mitochondrial-like [Dorcoceras hygrometricum]|uniref:Pentatricopeptide repeat-containing protein mitochondrial-like n=1 Tax=Dorcoceras hygrometricum TaxID=472368 RepID=A0A2Z7A9A6_9LAMI|nr:pentatricopeptide repeat-containing protein mitochondrial-like [Dorcoceras hygrometricum]
MPNTYSRLASPTVQVRIEMKRIKEIGQQQSIVTKSTRVNGSSFVGRIAAGSKRSSTRVNEEMPRVDYYCRSFLIYLLVLVVLLLVDVAGSARQTEEATRVSQRF